MRGAPQSGLAVAIFRIRALIAGLTSGRPSSAPGNPGPEQAKALAMPSHNRLRSQDDQRPVPILPTPGQPHPKEAIPPSQPRPGALALEHGELLTKGQVLQGDISEVSGRSEKTKQRTKQCQHGL